MTYNRGKRWRPEDIGIVLVDEASEGDVVTIKITVGGAVVLVMGEIRERGKRLFASGVHVSSEGVHANDLGISNLKQIALAVMEVGGYDEIFVEGAVRTTGAHPGRRPHPVRFARDRLFAPRRKTGGDEVD
jgi:hypothetical protein